MERFHQNARNLVTGIRIVAGDNEWVGRTTLTKGSNWQAFKNLPKE
jgi:hypothetical protein